MHLFEYKKTGPEILQRCESGRSCLNIKHFGLIFFGSFTVSIRKYSFVREKQTSNISSEINYNTYQTSSSLLFFSNSVIHNQREIFEWNRYYARKEKIIFKINTVFLKNKFKKYSERSWLICIRDLDIHMWKDFNWSRCEKRKLITQLVNVTTFSFFVGLSFLCYIFLRFKFKRFNLEVFCEKAALKFLKK